MNNKKKGRDIIGILKDLPREQLLTLLLLHHEHLTIEEAIEVLDCSELEILDFHKTAIFSLKRDLLPN